MRASKKMVKSAATVSNRESRADKHGATEPLRLTRTEVKLNVDDAIEQLLSLKGNDHSKQVCL